jgi:hypothetical protein
MPGPAARQPVKIRLIARPEQITSRKLLNLSISLPPVRQRDSGREMAVQEAVMARQNTTSWGLKAITGAAFVGIGLVTLFEVLDGPAARWMVELLGIGTRTVLELVLSLAPLAWQVLQACAFDHRWFSGCPLEMLLSCWPLLHAVAGAL